MDKNLSFVNEKRIEKTIKALQENNINAYLVKDRDDLLAKIEEIVVPGSKVGLGGSQTLAENDIVEYLRTNERYNLIDRYAEGLTGEQMKELHRQCFYADAYLTGTNAVTEDGELFNVDGLGNRVAAMMFGPDKVVVVVGVNKIVADVYEASQRMMAISAPANTKRLNTKTPCVVTGVCQDCSSPDRICREYTLIKRQGDKDRMHVIFLNDSFGY
ncbi:MAG: lactate utilization protein [Clostridioides sp.]|nr:lactate utilization protein [Clostridioides sp.]